MLTNPWIYVIIKGKSEIYMNKRQWAIVDKVKEKRLKKVGAWIDSRNEWIFRQSPKTKGADMEEFVKLLLIDAGWKLQIRNKKESDYDYRIDNLTNGSKVELKGSCLSLKANTYTFFQIRQEQKYDYLSFLTVEPNDIQVFIISKEDFTKYIINHMDEVIIAGGKTKREKLQQLYGSKPEQWMIHNDLFHWKKTNDGEWPEGTERLI